MKGYQDIIHTIITAFLASFGALARLLNQKDKTELSMSNIVSGCLVAAFAGVLSHFASEYFSIDANLSYILAGICGWIGPQTIDTFASIVMKLTNIKTDKNP